MQFQQHNNLEKIFNQNHGKKYKYHLLSVLKDEPNIIIVSFQVLIQDLSRNQTKIMSKLKVISNAEKLVIAKNKME